MIIDPSLKRIEDTSFYQSKTFSDPLYIRRVFALFAFLYGIFGLVDLVYFPEIYPMLLMIRFLIVIPILISVIILTYTAHYYRYHQFLITISFVLGGIGIAYMLLLKPEVIAYYGGIFMVLFSGYLLIRLRFKYASLSGFLIFLFYVIGYYLMHGMFDEVFFYSALFILGANLIGMVGAYNVEKTNRIQYQNEIRLRQANEALNHQNIEKSEQLANLERSIRENEYLKTINRENEVLTASLKDSEEQYRLLATEMHLGLALHDVIFDESGKPIDYVFVSVNDSYERVTGLKREHLIGKSVKTVLPEVEAYWIETFGNVAKTGKTVKFENYAKPLNRYYSTSAFSPKRGQFAVLVEDITERKIEEIEKEKREKDLLMSQKSAHLGTWRMDVKTQSITWSEELYLMYGLNPELPPPTFSELIGMFTKPSWDTLALALQRIQSDGTPYELELETIQIDGSKGWMWVKGEAEKNDDGEIVSVAGMAQNITERKRLEEELSESKEKFKAIFEQSPVAIEFYDANARHLYANQASIDLFGVIDPKEMDGKYLFDNPNLSGEVVERLRQNEQVSIEIEYDFEKVRKHRIYQTTKHGAMVLKLSITPMIRKGAVSGYILHSEDITKERMEQKEIEYISYHDYLTNLYNRRFFVGAYKKCLQEQQFPLGLMMIDINGLKIINDAYGHAQGDLAIKMVAYILSQSFGESEIVARIGGDEFAVLVPRRSADEMQAFKEKIIEKSNQMHVGNIGLSLAIGYEVVDNAYYEIDDLLSTAENYLYRHKVAVGSSVRNHAIKAILNTLTEKYEDEKIHSEKVSRYCKKMGEHLKLNKEEINLLELAGMYHDIGKISIPDAILNKPDKLTKDEFEIIKTHTLIGYQILKAADEYSGLAEYALSHHERWDGKGYPKGLIGSEIPLFSRIICVADSFEAMTADRPYRKGMSVEKAMEEIRRCSGSQFDPELATMFLEKKVYLE